MPMSKKVFYRTKTGEPVFRFTEPFFIDVTVIPYLWINSHVDPVDALFIRSKSQVVKAIDEELQRHGDYAVERSPIADDWEIYEYDVAKALGVERIDWGKFVEVIDKKIIEVWPEVGEKHGS